MAVHALVRYEAENNTVIIEFSLVSVETNISSSKNSWGAWRPQTQTNCWFLDVQITDSVHRLNAVNFKAISCRKPLNRLFYIT